MSLDLFTQIPTTASVLRKAAEELESFGYLAEKLGYKEGMHLVFDAEAKIYKALGKIKTVQSSDSRFSEESIKEAI